MMKTGKRRRMSPSMGVAILALFVALGGSAYAASKINGSAIKVRSIPGNRLKNATVTGTQVNASTLGTVPNATNATNATNAANANTLGGSSLASLNLGASTVSGVTSSSCDPNTTSFVDCGTVSLSLPRSEHVLLIANAEFDGDNSGAGYTGLCKLEVDGSALGADVQPGSSTGTGVGYDSLDEASASVNAVTGALAAGSHTFSLYCNRQGGSIEYPTTSVSALAFGTS